MAIKPALLKYVIPALHFRLSPVPLSVFTLAPDLSFEDRPTQKIAGQTNAKNTTVLQSISRNIPAGFDDQCC